ncbi:glycoside hydrolase family 16 protein [Parathielavia appendiculata]|uniref:chitinase n=1 Tax=Parathielavia appendiculata TaxID=2587402 RepID=A0AAN6Z5D3_9PEZI|nr:glycoside hydrolase family 16 protein [Parathielavia appendiculata]
MWPSSIRVPAAALLAWSAFVGTAVAQVHTDCFPMNTTCPPDPGFGMAYSFNFNMTPNVNAWKTKVGPVTYHPDTGASFKITKMGDSPTIETKFYYFWGRTEVIMKAAKGTGVISSIMLLSDNLDEIDWEFFGGNKTIAQSNYFGKGHIPDIPNAEYHEVPGNVQDDYHNYTTIWTKDFLDFYIDGAKVRRLLPADANNTYYYPQTPMRLSIGIWAGGDPRLPKGTREWAGGDTDYNQGPFEMLVKSAHVEDFSNGKEYEYTDRSGSWQSIKVTEGNSTVEEIINAPPEKSLSEKWNDLPNGAKIAIYSGAAGFVGLLLVTGLFYCIRQRRHGAREAKAAEARAEAERLELERFKKAGVDPDSFASQASEYNAKEMRRDGLTGQDSYSVPPSPTLGPVNPASPLDNHTTTNHTSMAAAAAGASGGVGVSAMRSPRSPVPLLNNHGGMHSPRVGSPGPGANPFADLSRSVSPQPHGQQQQQGMRSPVPQPQQYSPNPSIARSFSSPNPQMRVGSPAPSLHHAASGGGGGGMQRSASPAQQQMTHPQPQRSYTAGGYNQGGGSGGGGGYGGRNHQQGGYGGMNGYGQGGGGGGNQGYWGVNDGGGGYR